LEGHTDHVSSVSADFTITCLVAAVIDNAVAMSSAPDGKDLTFTSVNMPLVASLIGASKSANALDEVEMTKSSSPVIGVGPPLTKDFVDAGFGSIYETIGFTGALSCSVQQFGGSATRSKPLSPTVPRSPSSTLLCWGSLNLSSGSVS
jgi:hypothetical protein